MVCVVVFEADGSFGLMPTSEYDGDPEIIVCDYDPWEIMES
jgi:hypothetical protein